MKRDLHVLHAKFVDGAPTPYGRNTNNLGTTGQPVVIYLPSGTYLLDSPVQFYMGMVLIGDPINPPTIKASASFGGSTMIYAKDPHQPATNNFYIGIKNVIIDSTNINPGTTIALLDWSVSQATQLTNVVFQMPNYSTGHTGIVMPDNNGGSGTMMGDLIFNGGAVGINMQNQQYEVKSVSFNGCTTGILVTQCFDCVFVNLDFMNVAVGINMTLQGSGGSIAVIDSTASSAGTAIATLSETTGILSLVVENFLAGSGLTNTVTASGQTILTGSISDAWVYGNAYVPNGPATGQHQQGTVYSTPRSTSLLSGGKYFTMAPPTYKQYDVTQFVNVKTVTGYPVAGDGSTDDTASLNSIISMYAGCKILFFPAGAYIVTNTLFFPVGSRVVGEGGYGVQISASGTRFKQQSAPIPLIQVGNKGDKGIAQFSDLIFTVADILPGCILLEVNMAGNNQGDVGFWNTHYRIGGAAGSLVETQCGSVPANCLATFLIMHLSTSSSAYIENMWGWTADHDLDGVSTERISTGRGFLIEATTATWLHGTASEHNTLYQYSFRNAQNVFVGMQQSETPYWQGTGSPSLAPAPWTVNTTYGDPTFSNCAAGDALCRMAWFNHIDGSSNLFIYGSGFWVFYNDYNSCSNNGCQTNGCYVSNTTSLYWYVVNTRSVLNMIYNDGAALVTTNNNPGSWGGCVAAFLYDSTPAAVSASERSSSRRQLTLTPGMWASY